MHGTRVVKRLATAAKRAGLQVPSVAELLELSSEVVQMSFLEPL